MKLDVQVFLETNSLKSLSEQYGIKSSACVGDRFFSLNYDQILSKPGLLTNDCRGLVLAVDSPLTDAQINGERFIERFVGDTKILAFPFKRFFNHGDFHGEEPNLEDKETVFYEKLDGTCIILYFNDITNSWETATRAVPLANKVIGGVLKPITFRELFELALEETTLFYNGRKIDFQEFTKELDKEYTYVFELTTPINRIVVQYDNFRVHLLGVRSRVTGQELHVESLTPPQWHKKVPSCPSHKLNDLKELLEFVNSHKPTELEGIVVKDKSFRRAKIKSLAYVSYNKLKDSTSNNPRALTELILFEKLDDVYPILDQYTQQLAKKLEFGVSEYIKEINKNFENLWYSVRDCQNPRKELALLVQKNNWWVGAYMAMFHQTFESKGDKIANFMDFIETKKSVDGTLPNSILDTIIDNVNKHHPIV